MQVNNQTMIASPYYSQYAIEATQSQKEDYHEYYNDTPLWQMKTSQNELNEMMRQMHAQ